MLTKIKDFFLKNEQKMVLIVAFCLISAISFGFGVLQGQKWRQEPLIIEKPANIPLEAKTAEIEAQETLQTQKQVLGSNISVSTNIASCAFVGSKNSNKFYPPTCSYAKRIKPENVVCFKTAEEAIGQGRTESKCTN